MRNCFRQISEIGAWRDRLNDYVQTRLLAVFEFLSMTRRYLGYRPPWENSLTTLYKSVLEVIAVEISQVVNSERTKLARDGVRTVSLREIETTGFDPVSMFLNTHR